MTIVNFVKPFCGWTVACILTDISGAFAKLHALIQVNKMLLLLQYSSSKQ